VLDFDRFHRALHAEGGLESEGVHLPAPTIAGLRGHEAYAFAWFDNWTRDGQPPAGTIVPATPYPPSPDIGASIFAATGYATTGDGDSLAPEQPRSSVDRPARAPAVPRGTAARLTVISTESEPGDLARPDAPAPGWYPSPASPEHVQWWNGSAWTAERRPVAARRRGLALFGRR
jgi:hypothetical protein